MKQNFASHTASTHKPAASVLTMTAAWDGGESWYNNMVDVDGL